MLSTAEIYDLRGDTLASLSLQLRNLGKHRRFEGPIRTVRCYEDNTLVRRVLMTPGEGAVLVVDGGGSLETALASHAIVQRAEEFGWAGIVVNGAVRDAAILSHIEIGVKALGTNPHHAIKEGDGELDEVVTIGGVAFRPGARLWSDEDGILVER